MPSLPPWSTPRPTVAVLATGPSLTPQAVDQVRKAGLAVIAVNDAYALAPWCDVLYAADAAWWHVHAQQVQHFKGVKMTADATTPYRSVQRLKQTGVEGYDPTPGHVRTGGNGGYQAVHVAIQAGAKRILLLGFDMGGTHFFGRHPHPLRNTPPSAFANWIGRFQGLIGHGAEIINYTPGSALKCFPSQTLAEALNAG